ncbi:MULTISPECIES: crotonase/enoyl-CoA hydratase family protein [unclassified Sphingopyxis]|jgi:enoyl-CoA hydratase/carnithine racemase|uniref:crotonase/enoyl-CoA hydratase family protein n=1 Tax=unclassified Sphingopyxis TaxID=2614943 RepID=UPI0025F0E8CF|nr:MULTISPECIES: crotonase/enoyl-CoA hydratase family protein [unclassified Sphingopyxis]
MMFETLAWNLEDRILTLQLNRPDQLNAFTLTMADDLVAAFTRASEDDAVGAVIVTGEGRAFCAGMDLSILGNVFGLDESQYPDLDYARREFGAPKQRDGIRDEGGRVSLAIFACKKPVIAAINGAAVGVGATMTLGMDVRMASDKARIGFVFGKLGIVPEACSSWFLPRLVGPQQALEWTLSGEVFDAMEGLRGGLLRSIHPPEKLLDEARALARKFVENRSPVAVALTRQMMWRNAAQPHPMDAHQIDSLAMFYTSIADGKEGVAAFLEKRDPVFAGRASDMPSFYPW